MGHGAWKIVLMGKARGDRVVVCGGGKESGEQTGGVEGVRRDIAATPLRRDPTLKQYIPFRHRLDPIAFRRARGVPCPQRTIAPLGGLSVGRGDGAHHPFQQASCGTLPPRTGSPLPHRVASHRWSSEWI